MFITWLKFLLCVGVILYSGSRLSKYGDVIAEKTGLGRVWIGVVLMASVTSLPELFTGISSVLIFDVPDIAAGDVLGSCVFNMLIIALMDVMHGPGPIFSKADRAHILSAGFGIIMIGLVAVSILASERAGNNFLWIGPYTPAIILIYFLAMRTVFYFEKKKVAEFIGEMAEALKYEKITKAQAYRGYAINAIFVIAAATWLPAIGSEIANQTGLGGTFVGNIFIALATSMPEVVVSLTSLKIGATDMAIGNLFGSNIFNIFILAIDDLLYFKGPLLSSVSGDHVISAMSAIIMTAVAMVGLTYRSSKKALKMISWDALAIAIIYMLNVIFLYKRIG
ncbi:MAG: sodium:calcium antiporter [Nitrospirae bacterium]|nr:sodium:calcium antiporter [Nitrospirota bacterium]